MKVAAAVRIGPLAQGQPPVRYEFIRDKAVAPPLLLAGTGQRMLDIVGRHADANEVASSRGVERV